MFAFVPPPCPPPKLKKITSALPLGSLTRSSALRIGDVASIQSHFAGRVKVNSPTLNVAGASAAATPATASSDATMAMRVRTLVFMDVLLLEEPADVKARIYHANANEEAVRRTPDI